MFLPNECPYLFQNGAGQPLRYNLIRDKYAKAWKAAGLIHISGTHSMRYGAAFSARLITGSKDKIASITGHASESMVDLYSGQKEATEEHNKTAV